MKYTAFGEIRSDTGTNPTDYHEPKQSFGFKVKAVPAFTHTHGQRYEVELGLSYYVARWYDGSTAHFISADTIIPQPGNAGDWGRYACVLWNPMKYTDPSGHALVGPNDPYPMIDFEWEKQRNPPQNRLTPSFYRWNIKNEFGIIISDAIPPTWDSWYQAVYWAAWNQGFFYNTKAGTSLSPQEAFLEYQYDGITIRYQNEGLTETSYCYESSPSSARGACVSGADGAAYINIFNIELGEEDRDYLERLIHMEHELTHTVSWSLFYERENGPYYDKNAWYSALTDPYAGLADHSIWLQNSSITPNEVIANLTPAVAHGAWKNNYFGRQNAVMMGYYWTSWLSGGDKYDWIK